MKVRYTGETDISLSKGKVYEVISIENGWYRVVDDIGEDYLFSPDEFVEYDKIHQWATGTLREVPFWRDDMNPEEYDRERMYFVEHWDDYTKGKYTPLWKQKMKE